MEKYFGRGGDTGYNFAPDNGCGLWIDGGLDGFERLQNGSGQGPSVGFPATEWAGYDLQLDSASDQHIYIPDRSHTMMRELRLKPCPGRAVLVW